MTQKIERSIEELYSGDPERADALAFGRVTETSRLCADATRWRRAGGWKNPFNNR